jgi:predicted nucleic acid-binding protein
MSGVLIDTNVLSELRKGRRADVKVTRWYQGLDDSELYVSVLVLGEVRCGIERIRRRDGPAAVAIERWLDRLTTRYSSQILPVDESVADLWGALDALHVLPAIDGLLAATALAHDLTLATRNTKDVERAGARVVNPFLGP